MLSSAYLHEEGLFFCFAGPTASGKSSICKALVDRDANLKLSVSTTTRKPRGKEIDGTDYHFVTRREFMRRVEAGLFLEHATFGDNLYGTELEQIEGDALSDTLLDIDIQGVQQIKERFPERTVVLFVVPPSFAVLEQRLRERKTEEEDVIQRRLRIAREEFSQLCDPVNSDYLLVNDDLAAAVEEARAIIKAERRKLSRINPDVLDAFYQS